MKKVKDERAKIRSARKEKKNKRKNENSPQKSLESFIRKLDDDIEVFKVAFNVDAFFVCFRQRQLLSRCL